MGTEDTHWCNVCKRVLDKNKDKYVEFELVNTTTAPVKGKPKKQKTPNKPKGIICQNCIDSDPKLKEALEMMMKAGNPNFTLSIQCLSYEECETFEPSKKPGVNCLHIAVIDDRLYCKRSHPGVLELPREKAEVDRANRRIMTEYIKDFIKDPKLRQIMDPTALEKQLETIYLPPSSVIEEQHQDLPKQGDRT